MRHCAEHTPESQQQDLGTGRFHFCSQVWKLRLGETESEPGVGCAGPWALAQGVGVRSAECGVQSSLCGQGCVGGHHAVISA